LRGSTVAAVAITGLVSVAARADTFKVVIDAGHGGQNMGALGAYGVYEKHVTLSLATRLGRLLEAEPGLAVFYTRKDDVFVDLKDRPAMANAVGADVFVSVHTNASTSTEPSGIETFFLGGGSDPEADETASRENAGAPAADAGADDATVAAILQDLRHTANAQGSAVLAERVQRHLMHAMPETTSRSVRQARFSVLRLADMPAIVVEVGFLTNAEEGLNLLLAPYQERLAAALRDAIVDFAAKARSASSWK
jgi:N-acetylmuramoyl-L-alanine amidase